MAAQEGFLRRLTVVDVPSAFELSREAGWNQTTEDWRSLIEIAPETCLGMEVDGQVVSTATLMCYGKTLAWISMVLTRSSHRGSGYARRLLTEVLRLTDEVGIQSVKLDATEQGQPLYEKLGFRGEEAVERWEGRSTLRQTSYQSLPRYRIRICRRIESHSELTALRYCDSSRSKIGSSRQSARFSSLAQDGRTHMSDLASRDPRPKPVT